MFLDFPSKTEVLNIVSGKPVPPTQPGAVATSSVGPARGYAKAVSGNVILGPPQ